MNPIVSQSRPDHHVFYLTQAQLIRLYDGKIQCDAAESYEKNDDSTIYTFHLRRDLKWSSDTPLDAADFEYGVYCMLAPEFASPRSSQWYAIKNAEAFSIGEITDWSEVGVEALDNSTIQFTLERPMNDFDLTIANKHIYPINEAFVKSIGVDKLGSSVDTLLYAGPYVLTEWVLNSSMKFAKNDNYWGAAASFPTKNIQLLSIQDANTMVAMFENGELDAIIEIPDQYNDYLAEYRYSIAGGGFSFLWLNKQGRNDDAAALMGNINFRQALTYGFSRSSIFPSVSANLPANFIIDTNFLSPSGNIFIDEYPINTVPLSGDIDKAKEYLSKAMSELGYNSVAELPVIDFVTYEYGTHKLLCETIIDQWKQNLGIESVKFTQYAIGILLEKFYNLDYDILSLPVETSVRPTDIMVSLMTGGEYNNGIWSNERFDSLVTQAVAELDPVKKAVLIQQAEQIFMDDAHLVPIYLEEHAHAIKHYVSGFKMGATDGFEFQNLIVSNER